MKSARSTTVVTVLRDGVLAMACDTQTSWGDTAFADKRVGKVQRIGEYLCGFAGTSGGTVAVGDLIAVCAPNWDAVARQAYEDKMANHPTKATVALIGPIEGAVGVLTCSDGSFMVPDDMPVLAIGSGCDYAMAAGLALLETTDWPAAKIAAKAVAIAARFCIYTGGRVEVFVAEAEGRGE